MIVTLSDLTTQERQHLIQHAIAPRPICFASTVNSKGEVNLSPFSFFNLFSSNPPIVIFSPSRRVRDGSTKHTLQNILEVPEVVINLVDMDMVFQTSLASTEYPQGVNEFVKAGLTPVTATSVKPPMVKESKVKFECRVLEVKPLGVQGGAGNLVICELMIMHIDQNILNERGMIDQKKFHLVARLGGDWYCRVDEGNLFMVEKPTTQIGIGVEALPESIKNSRVLTGNNLGQLANVSSLPEPDPAFHSERVNQITEYFSINPAEMELELHRLAKELLSEGKVKDAWQVLLAAGI